MNLRSYISKIAARAAWITSVAALFVILGPVNAGGPWYVKPNGSDSNDCLSPDQACATINEAASRADEWDSIFAAAGIYTGSGDEGLLLTKRVTLSGGWNNEFGIQNGVSIIDGEDERLVVKVEFDGGGVMEQFIIQYTRPFEDPSRCGCREWLNWRNGRSPGIRHWLGSF